MRTVFRTIALSPLMLMAAGLLSLTHPAGSPGLPAGRPPLPINSYRLADSTALVLPADLEATVWAESSMLYRPTSIDIDARGRIWVAEAAGPRPGTDGNTEGRITILTDTNGDGRADNQTLFAQDARLVRPLGVSVLDRHVYVSNSPDLLMYVDENGDDQPERAETVLTGFGGKNQRNGVHRMVAGPAGNYYVSVGDAVPYTVTDRDGWALQVGTNAEKQLSSDGRSWVGGVSLRVKPDGSGLKVMADDFYNSQAMATDSYGNLWQADTDENTHTAHIDWILEGGKAGFYANKNRAGAVTLPGTMPVGDVIQNSSPTALLMYEDEKLGLPYRGTLLCADPRQHRIVAYKPEIRGAGYRLTGTDLISGAGPADARNTAFEPVAMAIGPDGALYVASWHEAGANSVGRIYRIAPIGRLLKNPQIDLRNTAGQLAALTNPAPQIRMLGFNALKQQGDDAVDALLPLVSSLNAYHRSRAIFLLAQLGPEGQFEVERLLKAPEAQTRIVALRALRSITPENSKANPALTPSQQVLLPLLGNLSVDQSVAVRREVCVALRDMPYADCRRVLANLVQGYDGQDVYYLNALSEAADGKQDDLFADLRSSFAADPVEWDTRTANLMWALHPSSALSLLRKRAEAEQLPAEARQQAIAAIAAIQTVAARNVMADLMRGSDKLLAASANELANARKAKPQPQTSAPVAPAVSAVTPVPTADKQNPAAMSPRDLLASKYGTYAERSKAVLKLAQTSEGARQLIDLVAENRLSNAMLRIAGPALLKHPSATIRQQAAPYFEPKQATTTVTADSTRVAEPKTTIVTPPAKPVTAPESVAVTVRKPTTSVSDSNRTTIPASSGAATKPDVAEIAALTGSATAGQLVFRTSCSRCHVYNQKGVDVGPELTNVQQQLDKNGLIESIVYPNASITPGYEPWLITTTTGQSYYGFISSETAQAVVVKGVTGQKHTLPINTVSSRRKFANSLMPSAQTMKLSQQQIADITAYLLKL